MHHSSRDVHESWDKPGNAPVSPDDVEATKPGDILQNTREDPLFPE
jgi:hypothetical protein